MATAACSNSTGEVILVYGDKSPQSPQDKDNALYRLPPGRKTPPGWDCDGVYVPNDRIAGQTTLPDIQGPVAIKTGLGVVDISYEITREGNRYILPPNQGAFKPSDYGCPTQYPIRVCWDIPNITQSQFNSFLEVPGHVSSIDGKWESIDDDKRFLLEIAETTVKWTERGTQSTTPGATLSRTVQLNQLGEKFRIERPNDMEVLTFLGYQPQSLRDAIIARNPQPSFIVFTRVPSGTAIWGAWRLSAEWSGLVVTKNPDGTLNEVIQPGVRPPKTFTFKIIL
ncbi:hypothetical protein C7B80_30075 [Cyanosarcina cf. burmensis CCALA 770]|nr:hypothetical protein C7B80_30075 [Cyanosarcina cf. burmensis CCALA 770]